MQWYEGVILFLSALSVGFFLLMVELIAVNDKLREENVKLKVDLVHK